MMNMPSDFSALAMSLKVVISFPHLGKERSERVGNLVSHIGPRMLLIGNHTLSVGKQHWLYIKLTPDLQ